MGQAPAQPAPTPPEGEGGGAAGAGRPRASGGRRSRFTSPRRRFDSARLRRDAFVRLGGAPRALHRQRALEPPAQALERQLAVARLAARVLRDGAHDRAQARRDPLALLLAQRLRGADVEHGLHARGGHVRVLAAGSRRAARAQLDLRERDLGVAPDAERIVHRSGTLAPGRDKLPRRCALRWWATSSGASSRRCRTCRGPARSSTPPRRSRSRRAAGRWPPCSCASSPAAATLFTAFGDDETGHRSEAELREHGRAGGGPLPPGAPAARLRAPRLGRRAHDHRARAAARPERRRRPALGPARRHRRRLRDGRRRRGRAPGPPRARARGHAARARHARRGARAARRARVERPRPGRALQPRRPRPRAEGRGADARSGRGRVGDGRAASRAAGAPASCRARSATPTAAATASRPASPTGSAPAGRSRRRSSSPPAAVPPASPAAAPTRASSQLES